MTKRIFILKQNDDDSLEAEACQYDSSGNLVRSAPVDPATLSVDCCFGPLDKAEETELKDRKAAAAVEGEVRARTEADARDAKARVDSERRLDDGVEVGTHDRTPDNPYDNPRGGSGPWTGDYPAPAPAADTPQLPNATPKPANAQLQGKLPDGFPGKAALEAAGITTYAQARKADLTKVSGIGDATALKIAEALGQPDYSERG